MRDAVGCLAVPPEPQAAFYDFLGAPEGDLASQLEGAKLLLVVDVGGGTTDLTLLNVPRCSSSTRTRAYAANSIPGRAGTGWTVTRSRPILLLCSLSLAFGVTCDKADGDVEPEEPKVCTGSGLDSQTDPEQPCKGYFQVRACCLGPLGSPQSEGSPIELCTSRLPAEELGEEIPGCYEKNVALVKCGARLGAHGCDLFEAFTISLEPLGQGSGPEDSDAPCYAEAVAAFEAGCNPYIL